MTLHRLILLGWLASSPLAAQAAEAQMDFTWPGQAKAAVSLAYDDALNSQLDHAIPGLNKYGLKGSFYLQLSNPSVSHRLQEWRAAAAQGHELANHTLFHHCSASPPGREWVAPHRDLDKISVAQLKDQIELGNTMLHAIDGKRERTFTTPCGDLKAGGADYISAIKSAFVAIKSGIGSGITPSMRTLDVYAVSVVAPENVSGQQLIDIVRQAVARGTMVNFTFHGIGGDYLTTSKQAHEELLHYLAQNQELVWTETFLNIMKYVIEQTADGGPRSKHQSAFIGSFR